MNGDIEGIRSACELAVHEGIPPLQAINEGMVQGLQIVGDKFEAGEFFLVELIAAGEAMKEGLSILESRMEGTMKSEIGKIVLGTVEGDLHSIGKDIASMLLRGAGFDVVDLGVDVPSAKFVEAVRFEKPQIMGLSALLTSTMPEMGRVIEELKKAGLREQVRIIVGGAPVNSEFATNIAADSYAPTAPRGVGICKRWIASDPA